jgi:hypothetical protein
MARIKNIFSEMMIGAAKLKILIKKKQIHGEPQSLVKSQSQLILWQNM